MELFDPRLPERFWLKIIKDEGGCWLWLGFCDRDGYGTYWGDGRNQRAHRFAYATLIGPPAEHLHHHCEHKNCVNPEHLESLARPDHRAAHAPARCKRGHPFDLLNTYFHPRRGTRHCRACQRERQREWARGRT